MGAVAPLDEKQALASELAEARRLIAAGDYTLALGALVAARECAVAGRDAAGLERVWELSRAVWERAPGGSPNAVRAARLGRSVVADLETLRLGRPGAHAPFGERDAAPRRWAKERHLSALAKGVVWTCVIWLPLLTVFVLAAAQNIYWLMVLPVVVSVALLIWMVGLGLIYVQARSRIRGV